MHTAQIDNEPVIDKDPHIIVAIVLKDLTALIRKGGMQLEGKVVVVRKSFVSKELAVNGEKVWNVEVKDPRPGCGLSERKGQRSAPIDAWHVVVPLRKGC